MSAIMEKTHFRKHTLSPDKCDTESNRETKRKSRAVEETERERERERERPPAWLDNKS